MQQRVAKYWKPDNSDAENRSYYLRDAQGNVLATYRAWVQNDEGEITWDSFALDEQHIYGSARVGMALPGVKLYPVAPTNPHASDSVHYEIYEGWKRYEITNHLGNVLAVITDRKRGLASSGSTIQWYEADVLTAQQYYPFGMPMPDHATDAGRRRQYSLNGADYRYGFNGKEGDDDEVKGDDNDNQQDYGMRIYDPRVGRFLSVDPMYNSFSDLSPYLMANNSPMIIRERDGKSGEPVFTGDKITINMDFYFYGTSRSLEDKDDFLKVVPNYLQTELNRYPSTAIGPDGQSYNVEFVIRGYVITEADALSKAKSNVGKNYDPKANFVRVDNGTQRTNSINIPALDFRGTDGAVTGEREGNKITSPDNSIWLNTNDLYTTSWLHEVVAHGLGNRDGSPSGFAHIANWDENNPSRDGIASIRAVLTTINIPDSYGFYSEKAERILLDLDKRGVLPEDKSFMQLRFWKKHFDGTYRGIMGGSTNTVFDRSGNQKIFDKNGNQKIFDKNGKPKE